MITDVQRNVSPARMKNETIGLHGHLPRAGERGIEADTRLNGWCFENKRGINVTAEYKRGKRSWFYNFTTEQTFLFQVELIRTVR